MITFDPLWKTLQSHHMNKEDLRKATGLSSTTIAKLSKNQSVMIDVVDRICNALDCHISDVVEFNSSHEEEP